MKKKDIHVVPNKNGGWDVQESGNKTPLDHKSTKKEAVAVGRELAKTAQVELVIHNKDGKISDKDSFGNDSKKVKDKKHWYVSQQQYWYFIMKISVSKKMSILIVDDTMMI